MTARDAALNALIVCRKGGAWSDSALKELLSGMDRRDAALASRLCYGVLQNRMLLDFWIAAFAKGKLQPVVQDVLRLAVYQLQFTDKIPASAAVNEAVEQTKRVANPAAARLVNGVLRAMLRSELPTPEDMATKYSHPQALVDLLAAQFGAEKTERLLQSHNEAPQTVLQINTLVADARQVLDELVRHGAAAQMHPWLENCVTVSGTGDLEQLDAYRNGWFYAQDAAAKLAVAAAELKSGMQVLDCCAAPGGKSFAAAIAMGNSGRLFSCDIHPHKLKLIENGASRLHISIINTRLQDASKPVGEWEGQMDAVLADVPCSGLGVIRKKPDIRYKDLEQTERLPELQLAILKQQASCVKPGGVLIYSTCTILRRENKEVAERFLAENPDFSAETVHFPPQSGIPDAAMTTLLPCDHGTDGFFICKFRRNA
ncbi:MAG: 16S rRNA (cytosine(967)-C(5))-methyltransferase RsmB [Oscillospiraceae bacterium]|nr:16S rRNA (cytosine(967)-C(5))-methyltransferase RsmB [Oscillospiraceae bacterium]